MDQSPKPLNQLTKLLDTNTKRKSGLKNFYMMVAEISKILNISEEDQAKVFLCMLEICKKLAKVADAVDDFEKTEKKELKKLVKEVPKHGNPELIIAEDSSKLEAIAEEVLSQGKSALDVAVKILEPLLSIKLQTYGKGGASVAKALKNNVPKELESRAQFLVQLVENQEPWLISFKKYRDDQHFKNIGITPLRANALGETERPRMPGPGSQPVADYLNIMHVNLYTFLMDFVAGALYIRLPNGLGLMAEGQDLEKRFRLAMEGSLAEVAKQ